MDIRFYNTYSHKVEPFAPISPPNVYMYNCGPTVYDFAHIGNFRAFIFADLLRRFLELTGHTVHQVMNITDVGHMTEDQFADGAGIDKMDLAAQRLVEAKKQGILPPGTVDDPSDPYQVARYYTWAFLQDAGDLGLKIATDPADPATGLPRNMPRATDYIDRMIRFIDKLIKTDHAYAAPDGAVYYSVQSFPDYGKLSGNTLEKLRTGAGGRVFDQHQALKKHPADFLLWKPDPHHIMKWPSPWGVGYPGWHIECSTMSFELLSQFAGHDLVNIDIHTGGEDNIFPHHECEIAQSVGATEPSLLHQHNNFRGFSRFWMHTRFLLVDGQKMSKSKGNFFTVRDALAGKVTGRPVDPAVLRYELLKSHYRSNMNFTAKGLEDSASAVQKLRAFDSQMSIHSHNAPLPGVSPDHPLLRRFVTALADDLNVSGALGELFTWLPGPHPDPATSRAVLHQADSVLNVLTQNPALTASGSIPTDATDPDALSRAIDAARKSKDFQTADRLRKELQEAGYEVMTTSSGTTARKKLA